MASDLRPGTYDGQRATLRYALEPRNGADSMLVAFPKLRAGAARPPIGLRRVLGDIDAHRLYLGSDEHTYIGPERRLGGFHAGMELIAREMNSPWRHTGARRLHRHEHGGRVRDGGRTHVWRGTHRRRRGSDPL